MNVNQKDIILIPFPFSDLSQIKRRPSIIISNHEYNSNNEDVICCAITSNPRNYDMSVKIVNEDLDSGNLHYESRVKPTKIFTLNKRMIVKKLAKLNIIKSKEIVKNLVTIQPYINVIGRLNSPKIDNCTQLSNAFGIDGRRLSIKN